MANFDDEFLKACYPTIELGVLRSLANRLGCYPEIFTDKYEIEVILEHLKIQLETFHNVLFVLSIYRNTFFTANQVLKIIMYVDGEFSLNKRNIERSYYFKSKNQPRHVTCFEDTKHQKSA